MTKIALQWRLVLAFGLIIVVVIGISGLIAFFGTINQFDVFVTEQNINKARNIAPLLETSYDLRGDWSGLTLLLGNSSAEALVTNPSLEYWEVEANWEGITASQFGVTEDELYTMWEQDGGTLAELASRYGVSLEQLVEAIFELTVEQAEQADALAGLSDEEVAVYLNQIRQDIVLFLQNPFYISHLDWDEIVMERLNLSVDGFYWETESQSIAEIAEARGVAPLQVALAIFEAERDAVRFNSAYATETAQLLYLADMRYLIQDYVMGEYVSGETFLTSDLSAGLIDNILRDERILIADNNDRVIYDSASERLGEQLPQGVLEQGVALMVVNEEARVGTVVVSANVGLYDQQQTAFLSGLNRALLMSGAITAVFAFLLCVFLAKRITAPVTAITHAARRIASGQSVERLPIRSEDELGQMSMAFNRMADALTTQRELRSRLVNDLSHELGTPLSIIQLEVKALYDGLQSPAETYQQVQREIGLLRNLVNDLSLLSETNEAQDQLVRYEPVDMGLLIDLAVERWQSHAEAADVLLENKSLAGSLPLVEADSSRLIQVLGNLINNAIRHTPVGGQVCLCCAEALLPADTISPITKEMVGVDFVVTTVTNTGAGIAAVDLPHVFERFYRADESRSRDRGGRGLGLAIVQKIVEQHGGAVWVTSEPGEVTTFGFALPVADAEAS